MRFGLGVCLALSLAGCAVPYDPEPVRHPVPLPAGAFDLALAVFRDRYRKIVCVDRSSFRIQSDWLAMQHGDFPGYRRASVYRGEDGVLRVVVEIYFVQLGPAGPQESEVRGDRLAERELAVALQRAIGR